MNLPNKYLPSNYEALDNYGNDMVIIKFNEFGYYCVYLFNVTIAK